VTVNTWGSVALPLYFLPRAAPSISPRAILASYSEKTAQVIGAESLKKPEIQAAIRAGYSEKTAEQMGYQLLQKTSEQEYLLENVDVQAKLLANVSQSCRMMGPP